MTSEEKIAKAILGYYVSTQREARKLLSGFSRFDLERIFRWTDKQESLIWEVKSKWSIQGVTPTDAERMHEILLDEFRRGFLCSKDEAKIGTQITGAE